MKPAAIHLKNCQFSYPHSQKIFSFPDLRLEQGEIALIRGGNGSGKTTLSKLCCRILQGSGTLEILGQDATKWNLSQIGQKVGYLFQEPKRQLFTGDVWSEMTLISTIFDENPEKTAKKAENLLKKMNLFCIKNRYIHQLSRGEQQRLALATLLMQPVDYLFLDEPTTGLDRENRTILVQIIQDLQSKGVGFAIISHDNKLAEALGNPRQITLSQGRIVP